MSDGSALRDLTSLVVPSAGSLAATGDPFEPYRLLDRSGEAVAAVAAYLRDLHACGRPATTLRSYGMDLLRWFRFLWVVEVLWEQATRVEARDFCLWLQVADKPRRPHWRHQAGVAAGPAPQSAAPNAVTGKPAPGTKYAAGTVAHCESVLRSFYDFHLEVGSGPMVNPFPLTRSERARRHRSPMEPPRGERTGRYRPRQGHIVAIRLETYDRRYRALAAQLAEVGFISPGSVVVRETSCGKPGCRCGADPPQRHGPYYQWSRAIAGKTVSRRLTQPEAELYRQWIANRKHLERIVTEMETLSSAAGEILLRQTAKPTPPRRTQR